MLIKTGRHKKGTAGGLIVLTAFILLQLYACGTERELTMPVSGREPLAAATADKHFGNAPLTVELQASGTLVSADDNAEFLWDFDDGCYGEGASVTHTFDSPGTFMVTLRARYSEDRTYAHTIVIITN